MTPFHTQKIKEAADILDVVARFVDLKKSGVRYVGLCPFHSERSPSFYVNPSKQIFHCFGCSTGGDVFAFVERHLKMDFTAAKKYLAGLYGIDTGSAPKKDFAPPPKPTPPPEPQPSFFPKDKMLASLKSYERNHFAQFLKERFGAAIASELIGAYFVGTSKWQPGANIFWQVDAQGRVRSGKIMVYNPATGKRDRDKMPTWTHKAAKLKDFVLSQCFYGECLLSKQPAAPVAIVESEKTAILASAYLPAFVWLAAGGKDGLGLGKCAVLKGRNVTLWPDAGAYKLWSDKAGELNKAGYSVTVSNLIETAATDDERAQGFDLADYLLRFDLAAFQAVEVPQAAPQCPTAHEAEASEEQGYPAAWDAPTLTRLAAAAAMLPDHWVLDEVEAAKTFEQSESEWAHKRWLIKRWYPGAFGIEQAAKPTHITRMEERKRRRA